VRIELQQLTVERQGRVILDAVDLVFPAGSTTVVMGHSGAGLSSLLKVAAGLIAPERGRVLQGGCDLASLAGQELQRQQTRTGFVFQDAALWANTNLLTNLDLPLQARNPDLDAVDRRQRIDSVLNSTGFRADLKQRPATLSLGQQKVVSFLRAVIPEPEALFLDEAMASLDRHWRQEMLRVLGELRERQVTLVAASHDGELARTLADRLVVLHAGRVLAAGTVAEVQSVPDPLIREIVHGASVAS